MVNGWHVLRCYRQHFRPCAEWPTSVVIVASMAASRDANLRSFCAPLCVVGGDGSDRWRNETHTKKKTPRKMKLLTSYIFRHSFSSSILSSLEWKYADCVNWPLTAQAEKGKSKQHRVRYQFMWNERTIGNHFWIVVCPITRNVKVMSIWSIGPHSKWLTFEFESVCMLN